MSELRNSDFYIKKLYRAAEVQDVNKDGTLTRADFDLMIKNYKDLGMPAEYSQELCDVVYGMCDSLGLSDHSKSLAYKDVANSWLENVGKQGDFAIERFDKIFNIIDTNRNGTISVKEWEIHYKAVGIPVEHAKASFEAMDTDKDGVISRDEFVAYHTEYFYSTEDKLRSSLLYGPLE